MPSTCHCRLLSVADDLVNISRLSPLHVRHTYAKEDICTIGRSLVLELGINLRIGKWRQSFTVLGMPHYNEILLV